MDLFSKGMTLNIRIVLILVVGLITVAAVMGVWGSVGSDTEDSLDSSTSQSDAQTSKSQCVTDCRFQYPAGGAEFANCKSQC